MTEATLIDMPLRLRYILPMQPFINIWLKFFFLFTPFFALSMFLSMTEDYDRRRRNRLVVIIMAAVYILCVALSFLGNQIFTLFGITLNAFRIGAGALLFLSAVSLAQGRKNVPEANSEMDIAVVPLAIPVIVGPATIGTLLVLGATWESARERLIGGAALLAAVISLGVLLLLGTPIERGIGQRGISILSKITGIILAALAAQMIMDGVTGFLA